MKRRNFLKNNAGLAVSLHPLSRLATREILGLGKPSLFVTSGPRQPLFLYDNWSAYDELSDRIPLTEELAIKELNELIRMKKSGVRFDYYVMDAFWFDKMGGYRTWNKELWPNGPDLWIRTCQEHKILPGMWFSTNLIATHSGRFLEVIPEWQDSLATDPNIMCLFTGGYLRHLGQTLQLWYDRGVRAFKFDFAYFEAATEAAQQVHTPEEIEEMNKLALMDMLKQFRNHNPDVLITGYNGFGGDMENTFTPFRKTVDPRWMEVFDTLYCGDPRFSDVPMMNIWRSQDNYSDHMARQFEFNGLPMKRIDNCAFMSGETGTCYYRAKSAWKGMLILELARGGWVNVYHGNMELFTDPDAVWFARVQDLFHGLQQYGLWSDFGPIPGLGKPYGFRAQDADGLVITLVNPSQAMESVPLPAPEGSRGLVIYADGGFSPILEGTEIRLGPEQLVVVGFGKYSDPTYQFGVDDTIRIPTGISSLNADFTTTGPNQVHAQVQVRKGTHTRILLQQFGPDGNPRRSWGGAPPDGKKMDAFLKITCLQDGRPVTTNIEYDKMIWSGLSWAAASVAPGDLDPAKSLEITCRSFETDPLTLKASVYEVIF